MGISIIDTKCEKNNSSKDKESSNTKEKYDNNYNNELGDIYFPHDKIRSSQNELIVEFVNCLENKKHLIAHAPTGIGKTSVLGPALAHALKNKLTVFFLTSRHTQHLLAIQTLKKIKEKYNPNFSATGIIGKKWMCNYEGMVGLQSRDFAEYCKTMKENDQCEHYRNIRNKSQKLTELGKNVLETLKATTPNDTEKIISVCRDEKVCPYEIAIEMAKDSDMIITDYFYIFSPDIMEGFFQKTKKEIDKCILIIDEGHNLPNRIRELLSENLTTNMIMRAIKEAKKFGFEHTIEHLVNIQDALNKLSKDMRGGNERLILKNDFVRLIGIDFDEIIADLDFVAETVRKAQKQSYISGISKFLNSWLGADEGYTRILSYIETAKGPITILRYKCLDPSIISSHIIKNSYSTLIMSGTLSPTKTYKEILGFPEKTKNIELISPFPKKNRLNIIIPETSTKFTTRGQNQYRRIGEICATAANLIPGNCAIFFPSYFIRDEIYKYFRTNYKKKIFLEDAKASKDEKNNLLEKFKKENKTGSCLLAISAANFGEGIDLPGELLIGVIVVGLPLQKPDLETKELIKYYDKKFGNGWEYGYTFPAFTKTLQTAGRCIRDENDRGVIIFLDERYAWANYIKNFPKDWDMIVSKDYEKLISGFFSLK